MIVLTMLAEMMNSIESAVRSVCWCKVLMRFTLFLKYSFLCWSNGPRLGVLLQMTAIVEGS